MKIFSVHPPLTGSLHLHHICTDSAAQHLDSKQIENKHHPLDPNTNTSNLAYLLDLVKENKAMKLCTLILPNVTQTETLLLSLVLAAKSPPAERHNKVLSTNNIDSRSLVP